MMNDKISIGGDLMPAIQKSLRFPSETVEEINKMAKETGRDFTSITIDLLSEAIKIRRCPGIVFVEGVTGRRARIAGTGIEIWEVIANYASLGKSFSRLKKTYHWLSPEQIRAALGYYATFPEEIDHLIQQNADWNPDKIKERHPLLTAI
jgi:uncharacterized protein (DUF433 family)